MSNIQIAITFIVIVFIIVSIVIYYVQVSSRLLNSKYLFWGGWSEFKKDLIPFRSWIIDIRDSIELLREQVGEQLTKNEIE